MKPKLRLPSPAMIVACIALLIALGGTSYAAIKLPKNSVGTKQLKKNAVTSPKVKDNSITGADVLESSLGIVPSATNATTATTAGDASTLNGRAANALTRGAGTKTGAVPVTVTESALASVTLTVPATGYVLVTASAGPKATASCPCRFVMRLQDPVSGDLSNYIVDTVAIGGFTDGYDGGEASTHLFAVTVAAPTSRTFNVLGYMYGTGTVEVHIDVTALWVPFGAVGTGPMSRPQGAPPTRAPGKD
jgi:hypothetical protein